MKVLSKVPQNQDTLLLATIADRLGLLVWANTEDAQNGQNRPNSILEALLGVEHKLAGEEAVFSTAEEFEIARQRILEKEV